MGLDHMVIIGHHSSKSTFGAYKKTNPQTNIFCGLLCWVSIKKAIIEVQSMATRSMVRSVHLRAALIGQDVNMF